MESHRISHNIPGRAKAALVRGDPATSGSASIHFLNSSIRPEQFHDLVHGTRMPSTSWNEIAEIKVEIDGQPILFRFLAKDVPAEIQSGFVANHADVHSRLASTLEKIVEMISHEEALAETPAPPTETVLRVGPLELDLLDRTVKRGDRQIDLRPREFRLLKYMMERSNKLLARATLLMDVWNYKFVPDTNLVDVHMGRLRRKVDGPNEPPMIRSVRGVGFVLDAVPLSQD
jgi:DNA-binding winged helix-turn-helix (wHTH) protein